MHLAGPSELLCVHVLPTLVPLVTDGVQLRVGQGLPEPLPEEMRTGRHDLVIATLGRALESVPLADEEYLLAPAWARRIAAHPQAEDLCATLREVPLGTCAEDLPIVRRHWRTVFGRSRRSTPCSSSSDRAPRPTPT